MNRPLVANELAPDQNRKFSDVQALVDTDIRQLDQCIRNQLRSNVALINQISEYIIYSGGKRIRPLLLITSAKSCGYSGDLHILLAAVVEFIHTATLLHDDVVDESDLRRGQRSAHSVWGNAASVLVGDFLYSRSFQMMVDAGSMQVMDILAETTNTIAEGEVQQLMNLGDPDVDEHRYMKVIKNKTAKLFEAACQIGAILAQQPDTVVKALKHFGNGLGRAFQIADDILDYQSDSQTFGKNIGDDLAEGKPTLPLIYARQKTDAAGRKVIDRAIQNKDRKLLSKVIDLIKDTGALESARQTAENIAIKAAQELTVLPPSEYRSSLEFLSFYAVNRRR